MDTGRYQEQFEPADDRAQEPSTARVPASLNTTIAKAGTKERPLIHACCFIDPFCLAALDMQFARTWR